MFGYVGLLIYCFENISRFFFQIEKTSNDTIWLIANRRQGLAEHSTTIF